MSARSEFGPTPIAILGLVLAAAVLGGAYLYVRHVRAGIDSRSWPTVEGVVENVQTVGLIVGLLLPLVLAALAWVVLAEAWRMAARSRGQEPMACPPP
jgi:uncharacterized iron-regulated membrane protein